MEVIVFQNKKVNIALYLNLNKYNNKYNKYIYN